MSAETEIRTYAERIVALEIERRELASDIKDLKAEAKGRGLSPKLITACVRMLLLEADKRAAALSDHEELDLYLNACGLLSERGGEDDETRQDAGGTEQAPPTVPVDAPIAQGSSPLPRMGAGDDTEGRIGRVVTVGGDESGTAAEVSPDRASKLGSDTLGDEPKMSAAHPLPGTGRESPGTPSPSGWPRAGLQNQAQGVRLPPAVPDHGRHSVVAGGAA